MTTILATIANRLPNQFFTLFSVKVMNLAIEKERINLSNKSQQRAIQYGFIK